MTARISVLTSVARDLEAARGRRDRALPSEFAIPRSRYEIERGSGDRWRVVEVSTGRKSPWSDERLTDARFEAARESLMGVGGERRDRSRPSQKQMFEAARRRSASADQTMLDLLYGPNPISDDELRRLIAKRPEVYGKYKGYLGKRGAGRDRASGGREPKVYLSTSEGKFRVISQGLPISVDKRTAAEALAAAEQFKLKVSDRMWDGDAGQWRPLQGAERDRSSAHKGFVLRSGRRVLGRFQPTESRDEFLWSSDVTGDRGVTGGGSSNAVRILLRNAGGSPSQLTIENRETGERWGVPSGANRDRARSDPGPWWLDIKVRGGAKPVRRLGPYDTEEEANRARERTLDEIRRRGWSHVVTLPLKGKR